MRFLVRIVLLLLATVLVLPFVLSSLYIDQRGVIIPGRVAYKREDVVVRYSKFERSSEVTIEYSKPDGSGVDYQKVQVSPAEYDAKHIGQAVSLHYLRPQDLPDVPLIQSLRRAQLLPMVRLADHQSFSGLRQLFTGRVSRLTFVVGGVAVVLLLWRIARIPGFAWACGFCILAGITVGTLGEFPQPLPAPTLAVRHAIGTVKELDRIDKLFSDTHQRGWETFQPVQVLGVQFTPEGRTEPVLAVDLIDEGSVPGLKEHSSVPLDYEASSPRTAYIAGATRNFPRRNMTGVGLQALACVAVSLLLLLAGLLLRGGYRRLTNQV